MDDANLALLSVDQKGLTPSFNKDIIDYFIIVPFNVLILNVKATTSDTGASFSVKSNTGFGQDVKLVDGENKITIEVTSEDGTVKKYFINLTRLSASDAQLNSIEFTCQNFKLKPAFDKSIFQYYCLVDYNKIDAKFKLDLFDSSYGLEVSANKIKIEKKNDEYLLNLCYGCTELNVNITSPNKSNNQNYVIKIIRSLMPRLAIFSNITENINFEDSISLAPLYCPVKFTQILSEPPYLFSEQILKVFQNMVQFNDELNLISLSAQQNYSTTPCFTTENKLSEIIVKVPYLKGGYSNEIKLRNISDLIEEINKIDEISFHEDEIKNHSIISISKIPDSLPSYQTKPWEKHYMIIYDVTDVQKLIDISQSQQEKYFDMLLNSKNSIRTFTKDTSDSPIYFLNMSLYNLASSIKHKSKDYQVHFKFAALLEEKNFFENIYGKEKINEKDESVPLTLSSQNKLISDGSKEEEINAICKSRNFGDNPSDADKLKALDQEYHFLMENNQSHKAEQVQLLYQFKSKKISEASKTITLKMNQASDYLIQSNLKYIDGLSIFLESKISNFQVYFTIGRSYCLIHDYTNALIYLKQCINWSSDLDLQTLARFYYGYALSKNKDLLDSNTKLVVLFIVGGLQAFLKNLSNSISNRKILFAYDYFSVFNTIFLEGFLTLGKIKSDYNDVKVEFISAEDSFKYCSWICCLALNEINNRSILNTELIKTSNLVKDIVRILIESHQYLINLTTRIDPSQLDEYRILQSKRCLNFINIIRTATDKNEKYILKIQENAAQRLVFCHPFESYFLLLLGCAKLELYEYLSDNVKNTEQDYLNELLNQSKNSLMAIIEYESDKNLTEVSALISEQKWWNELVVDEQKKINPPLSKSPIIERPLSKNDKTSVASIKTPAKAPTLIKQQSTKKPVSNQSKAQPNKITTPSNKPDCKPIPPSSSKQVKPSSAEVKKNTPESSTVANESKPNIKYVRKDLKSFDKNIVMIQTNLYLGRVYSKLKEIDKAKSFYDKVIKHEPNNRDSYIELAKVLRENDDLPGAIDVYSAYPITEKQNENQLFEDAFIYGELVTLLVNSQKYDDPRLTKYLILWAKIMGVAIIEKYINILDKANKTKVCKEVYAGVNKKSVDDPDLAQFFKFKGWI